MSSEVDPRTPAESADEGLAALARCKALLNGGENAQGEREALALHARAVSAGRHSLAAEAALLMCKLHANSGQPRSAVGWAEKAIAHGVDAADPYQQATGWIVLAGASAELDDTSRALQATSRAMSLLDAQAPTAIQRSVFTGLTITYNALGLSQLAWPAAQHALALELSFGRWLDRVRARWNLLVTGLRVQLAQQTVHPERARVLLDELVGHAERLLEEIRAEDVPDMLQAGSLHAIGQVLQRAGRLDEAIRQMTLGLATWTEEPPLELLGRWVDLAKLQRAAGDTEGAAFSAAQAEAHAQQIEGATRSQDLPTLAELAELRGRPEEALQHLRRHHAQVVHNLLDSLDQRVAELTARIQEQSLHLENAELRARNEGLIGDVEQMSRMALTDALTGLPNRRALERAFEVLKARAARFAVLMIDVDHFKSINDGHSHVIGDAVLKTLALLLKRSLREPDTIGRYGGEEFVVLLATPRLADAFTVAERLRCDIERHDWSSLAAGLVVTISGGLVAAAPVESFPSAVERADRWLYQAKRDGRNRILGQGADAAQG